MRRAFCGRQRGTHPQVVCCHSHEKIEELASSVQAYRVRNAIGKLLSTLVQHTGEFEHSAGLRVLRDKLDAVMYARSLAPEEFSISSVRAMIAASGGATFTMVIHERAPNDTRKLTFCTLR